MKRDKYRLSTLIAVASTPVLAAAAPADEGVLLLDEVVVTGTRINRSELDAPNPVQSLSADLFRRSGETELTDFLRDVPALSQSRNNEDTAGSNIFSDIQGLGVNSLDLRALGTSRTLVLVNGRRHVAGVPGSAAVDINSIPSALVERVDVLTGGISAVYGADGVTGVVNFITRRDFEGIESSAQFGTSDQGDADTGSFSLTAGTNFANGRGNVAVAYEYRKGDPLSASRRSFLGDPARMDVVVRNPDDPDDDPDLFDRIALRDVRYSDSSPDAALDLDGDYISDLTGSGAPYDYGLMLGDGFQQGGSGTPVAWYTGDLLPRIEQHNVNLLGSFEITPSARLYGEAKYATTDAQTTASPNFDFGYALYPDNVYLADLLGQEADDFVFYSRDNLDMPLPHESADRETLRGVVGMDGRLSDHLSYDVSYVYGETKATTVKGGSRYGDRYFAALDAVMDPDSGDVVCRSDLLGDAAIDPFNFYDDFGEPRLATTFTPGPDSGCLPLNILGTGVGDPAAIAWMTASPVIRSKITQEVTSAALSGDSGAYFTLPGGPLGFAVGAEYRKETSESVPDEDLQTGNILQLGPYAVDRGDFDVTEFFAEINLPVLKDARFAKLLSIGAAGRLSDYSTVGSTSAWKLDAVYAPVSAVSFRGGYSRAVRAPNIAELFAGTNASFTAIDDPCGPLSIDSGSAFRADNCVATLQSLGFTDEQIDEFDPGSLPSASVADLAEISGNPQLQEETATTWTVGIVLRPAAAPGLSVAFDWYDIDLEDAIETAEGQDVADLCVDLPTIDNPYCGSVERDGSDGSVVGIFASPQNVANVRTSGLDLTLNYVFSPSERVGTFETTLLANYLHEFRHVATPSSEPENRVGELPEYQGMASISWLWRALTLTYGVTWQAQTHRFSDAEMAADPDLAPHDLLYYKAGWEHDLQASVEVGRSLILFGGISNLTDEQPDIAAGNVPVSPIGRSFYAGLRYRM
jgi:iron complex outermembrane recepter protein